MGAGRGQAVSREALRGDPGLPPGGTHGVAAGGLAGWAGGRAPFTHTLVWLLRHSVEAMRQKQMLFNMKTRECAGCVRCPRGAWCACEGCMV